VICSRKKWAFLKKFQENAKTAFFHGSRLFFEARRHGFNECFYITPTPFSPSCKISFFSKTCFAYQSGSKSFLPAPHSGQIQSSGKSSKAVPAATPLSGSPTAGS
jgi:hypothetical protein